MDKATQVIVLEYKLGKLYDKLDAMERKLGMACAGNETYLKLNQQWLDMAAELDRLKGV